MKKLLVLLLVLTLFSQFSRAQKNPRPTEKWVEKTLKSLTLRQKIGQMINFRIGGEFSNVESEKFKESAELVSKHAIGGFTVYRGSVHTVAALTNELQKLSQIPLLFSADYERGLRMQMPFTGTAFTTAMGVGATGNPQSAFWQGKITCEEMRAIGVHWQFAPVADLNNNPDNPVINVRSFGENPEKVSEFVSAFSQGTQAANCLSTIKHFPGHGDTAFDSHIGLPSLEIDKKRLDSLELVPFKKAIAKNVDSVMTAHLAVPKVTGDDIPATLNPKISTDLLRNELGFNGIIVTDAMEMGAIIKNYSPEKSVVMAVKAGADVVLLPLSVANAVDSLESAVKKGEISEERINFSVRKILSAKNKLGLTKNRFVSLESLTKNIERPENVKQANKIIEESITLLRNDKELLPLTKEKAQKTLFLVIAADDEPERVVEGVVFIPEVLKRVPQAKIYRLDLRTTQTEYQKILEETQNFETIVLVPFVKRAANKGTVALPEQQTAFVKKMLALEKDTAVIAFGSPYLIRQFPEAKTYAVTYAIEEVVQTATVKNLFGEAKFQGKLPVSIPNLFAVGSGITK